MDRAAAGRRLFAPAFVLGFAFSGLFDGILLHQLLQWHHLLSLVEGEPFRDLRVQVFADGAFHILMYFVAAGGLWLLWRARTHLAAENGGRRFLGAFVFGLGAWNVVDAVVFHWVLRIHHIRLDPDQALLSDVLWLIGLGLVPAVVGWTLWKGGGRGGGSARSVAAGVALLVVGAGAASLVPSRSPLTAVLFRPGLSDIEVLRAVAAVDGRLAWVGGEGDVVVLALKDQSTRWALYRHGAILVGGAGPAGCLGWARPA